MTPRARGVQPPEPTRAEIRTLRAYLQYGGVRPAAMALGLAESTVKNTLANVRSRIGARTTAEAVYLLHDRIAA